MSATADPTTSGTAPDAVAPVPTPAMLGTPYGRWQGVLPAGEVDVDVMDGITRITGAGKDCPALVFVDGPAHSLACWLAMHPDGDPARALADWCDGARLILRRAHAHPASCVLVDAAEAALQPAALRELVSGRFGAAAVRRIGQPTLREVDPVALALAAGLARESRQAQALYAQLQASCMPLTTHEPDSLAVEVVDHDAAVRAWQALVREPPQVKARAAAETAELKQSLERQRAQAWAQLNASRTEANDLLLQLHQTQETLEEQLLARQKPHPSEAVARQLTAEMQTLRQVLDGQAAALAEQTTALAQARRASDALQQQSQQDQQRAQQLQTRIDIEQQASRAAAAQHEAALADARQEADRLQMQLHTVQEELAHHYLALKALENSAPAIGGGRASLRVDELVVTDAVHTTPHHHLQLALHQVRMPHGSLARLTVRLAEHHGRPGLVLLAPEDDAPVLGAWQATGHEDGRELMTLVPSDPASQRHFERMASADWRFVTELVALIHHRLAEPSLHPEAARWRAVAARLQRQLAQLPPRLRYSELDLSTPDGDAGRAPLAVRFGDVVFGRDGRPDLHLLWRPGASHGSDPAQAPLRLVLGNEGSGASEPPLAGWPYDAEGRPATDLVVPVGPGLSAAEKRHRWAALQPADRELVLALLDALPACAERALEGGAAGLASGALEAAARTLYADAQRSQRQARWRRGVRAVLRRARGA